MATNQIRPRLVRRTENKIIAGVASGIADHFNVDPILVRVAFVLLAFAGAIGFVAYGAAWLLIPAAGEPTSPAERMIDKVGGKTGGSKDNTWIWIIILAIAGVLILANLGHLWSGGGIVWALILLGVGTWLYLQDLDDRKPDRRGPATALAVRPDTAPAATEPAVPPAPAAEVAPVAPDDPPADVPPADPPMAVGELADPPTDVMPAVPVEDPAGSPAPDGGPTDPAGTVVDPPVDPVDPPLDPPKNPGNPGHSPDDPPAAAALPLVRRTPTITQTLPATEPVEVVKPRRRRSRLGRYTVAAALVLVGAAALLDNMGTIALTPIQYGGLVLATLGGGLLIGTFFGRARSLIFLGILMIPLLLLAGLYTRWFDGPVPTDAGDRNIAPASVADLESSYRLGAGSMNFDLNRMTWGSDPVELDASVGAGEINVSVPEGVEVDVRGRAAAGAVSLFDQSRASFGVDYSVHDGDGGPKLTLDLRSFVGQVEVVRSKIPAREL